MPGLHSFWLSVAVHNIYVRLCSQWLIFVFFRSDRVCRSFTTHQFSGEKLLNGLSVMIYSFIWKSVPDDIQSKRRRLVFKTGVIMYIQKDTSTNYSKICLRIYWHIFIFIFFIIIWIFCCVNSMELRQLLDRKILQNITRHPNLKAPEHFFEIPCILIHCKDNKTRLGWN